MRKILFVINPVAGTGKAKKVIPYIKEMFNEIEYTIKISTRKNIIEKIVEKEMEKNYTDIVAVGGDGTLTEVIAAANNKMVNVGVVPVGSGNDFAKSMNISENIIENLNIIKKNNTKKIYVSKVNEDVFVNVLGVGIDAEILKEKNKNKYKTGKLNYLINTLKKIVSYTPKRYKIYLDNRLIETEAYIIAIGNGKYFGNGMMITPDADPSSEIFQVCIVRNMPVAKLMVNFYKIFKGTHNKIREVEFYNAKEIRIEFVQETDFQKDGNLTNGKNIHIKQAYILNFLVSDEGDRNE